MSDSNGCPDCRSTGDGSDPTGLLSRRSFLRRAVGTTAAAMAGLATPQLTTRVAFADTPAYSGDVLVVLSMRGGFDGLSAIVPLGDPDYRAARPGIAIPEGQALSTGSRFWGLHPGLAPLKPWWDAGSFGAIQAVGAPDPTRSHFAATEAMERAAPGSSLRTGWIDRTLGLRSPSTVFQGVAVGDSLAPASMAGPFAELAFNSIDEFNLSSVYGSTPEQIAADGQRWASALTTLHARIPSLRGAAGSALGAVATARALKASGYSATNGAVYPHLVKGGPYEDSHLSTALFDAARLVRANVGLQLVCLDYDDWDMHANLGTVEQGRFRDRLSEWSASIAAFLTDLGPDGMQSVAVVTLSEFGRRVKENGDLGVDHGHGNAMLLFGGGVVGGTVHGTWPGLAPERLDDGDLAGTTDYRDVLAEALTRRCRQPASDLAAVFPNRGAFATIGAFTQKS
ncbi:MAG: DUF1501 domain-containing protein [Actinomycetes bacterium]